jgi:N-acetylglutamate synthase-like GNAT family acetyltransferase
VSRSQNSELRSVFTNHATTNYHSSMKSTVSPTKEAPTTQKDSSQICFCIARGSALRAPQQLQNDLIQLQTLFEQAAFWAQGRSLEDLNVAIANSEPVVSVWDGERLIGFARANSDGIYRATIWDVVIHPDYQGRGLGRKLVQTVLSHPRLSRVERIYLMTTHQQRFYERIGFECNSSTTMVLKDRLVISSLEQL